MYSLIVPESTRNYVENPSFEKDAAGYGNIAGGTASGSRTRVTDWQRRGIYAYKIIKTAGAAGDDYGFDYPITDVAEFLTGDYAAFGIDINLTAGDVHLEVTSDGATTSTLDITTLGVNRYTVIHGPFTSNPTTLTVKAYINVSATGTFYADGLQVEKKAYATSYCDGDMKGCRWAGVYHSSPSVRDPNVALGGRDYPLNDLGYYPDQVSGLGMPPLSLITQLQALLPGVVVRGYNVHARTIQLGLGTSANDNPLTQAGLHSLRKALIDYLKPDRYGSYKPLTLRYTGANTKRPVDFEVYYDSGLEYNAPIPKKLGFHEAVPLRFFVPYPFAKEEGERAYSLNSQLALTSVNQIVGKKDGVYAKLGTGASGTTPIVHVIKRGPDGKLYIGGKFDGMGGVANTKSLAVFDPETGTYASLNGNDTGAAGNHVKDITFDALGNVYICGTFTAWASVANSAYIAKWTRATATWSSITPTASASAAIESMAFERNGDLTVVGHFTTINGVSALKIAKLSGTTWSAYSTGLTFFTSGAKKIIFSPEGTLYVGGIGSSGIVQKWTGSAFATVFTSNAGGTVQDLLFANDGLLYIAGGFTSSGVGTPFNNIVAYNGLNLIALGPYDYQSPGIGGGVNLTAQELQEDSEGRIWMGGFFTSAGGKTIADNIAIWDGSLFLHGDIDLPASSAVYALLVDDLGTYIGFDTAGTTNSSQQTSVTYEGTEAAYPKIIVKRTGGTSAQVQWVENYTTGTIIWIDYPLQDGETLTLDLTPGEKHLTSSLFGEVWDAIRQTSDFTEFRLIPGTNLINTFVKAVGSPTVEVYIQASNTFWSVDGVAV